MKKFIALLLAAIMCLSICACGGNNTAPETEAPTEPELRLATTDDTEEEIVLTLACDEIVVSHVEYEMLEDLRMEQTEQMQEVGMHNYITMAEKYLRVAEINYEKGCNRKGVTELELNNLLQKMEFAKVVHKLMIKNYGGR